MLRATLSLKYRIALTIFILEAILVGLVLGSTLNEYIKINTQHADANEKSLVNILSTLSRTALLTAEYGSLQPYIEEIAKRQDIDRALVINANKIIVVSNDVLDVGKSPPDFTNASNHFWHVQDITNATGNAGMLAILFSHQALTEANDAAFKKGVTVAAFGIGGIAIFSLLTGFLLTRRLDKLKQAADNLANGNLSIRANISGRDEIAIVGHTFDQMASSIENYVHDLIESENRLRKAHDELEQRISERTHELAVARDQALEASRSKSAFLANMSHELRTPLNAIIGYSEIIQENLQQENNTRYQQDLTRIINAGNHLLNLITDILDLSKIEAGKMTINYQNLDVRTLVDHIIETIAPLIEKNCNKFNLAIAPGITTMETDPGRLQQILINVLGNACKFTENGIIELRVDYIEKDRDMFIRFSISDTGIGIPQDKIENLFNEFTQVDDSSTRRHGGTGLGLAICKQICNLMAGDISVTSIFGSGSTFVIDLPRFRPEQPKLSDTQTSTSTMLTSRHSPLPVASGSFVSRRYTARILIIGTDASLNKILLEILHKSGFETMVSNPKQAASRSHSWKPDVIIVDQDCVTPPELNWLASLSDDATRTSPSYISLSTQTRNTPALPFGVTASINKPADESTLLNAIIQSLRNNP